MLSFKEKIIYTVVILVILIGLILALFWMRFQWKECKENGFSNAYCFQHIS
jgi:hypothetical protein